MIRVLLADQDDDNRKNFKTFIRTGTQQFRVQKQIKEPSELKPALQSGDIDVILGDIRFFGASSMQVMSDIHHYYPDVLVILYGTFNDAEYMEKCMEYGVVSFMFKPVKPSDIAMTLNRVQRAYEKVQAEKRERERIQKEFEEKNYIFEDRFLLNLIHGGIDNEENIIDNFKLFEMNLVPPYTVFVIELENFKQISLSMNENEKQFMSFNLLYTLQEKLKRDQRGVAFMNHIRKITALVGGFSHIEDIIAYGNELKDAVMQKNSLQISIGIGKSMENTLDIPISYKQAKASLRYRWLMGSNMIIPIHYVEPDNHITYRYPLIKEELLVYTTVAGDLERLHSLLTDLKEALHSCGPLPRKLLPKIILDILVSVNRYASEQNMNNDIEFGRYVVMKELNQVDTVDKWYAYMQDILDKFAAGFIQARKKQEEDIYNEVKYHADNQYYESISLNKMGVKAGCTPEYLNRIFMQREERSYFDYVVSVRMDKAKELLEATELEDENIAVLIGYDDVRYFRSLFYQITGITTQDYRLKKKSND